MSPPSVRRAAAFALVLTALLLFFVANRAAYKGYFSDDDLVNIGWPTYVGDDVFVKGLLSPLFSPYNFRPVGFLYYRYLGRAFHLDYPPYVAALQALHVLNVLLLYWLLRRLDLPPPAAVAGASFYLFHAAVLEAFWKPMYIFEVLCATFCLLAFLLYLRGRWILALVPFWLAYKSKELAVTLPAALLAYEYFMGKRQWKRLIPYVLISLSFGLQAIFVNRAMPHDNPYAMHFSMRVLWDCIAFYSSALFFVPFAGLALLLLPVFVRDRRLYVGLVFVAALLAPMLVLPGRLISVYWYVPMIGLSIAVAVIAARVPQWAIALFFIAWFPLNYILLRDKRREILALADENRWYTTGLQQFARHVPPLKAVVYQGTPAHMAYWGIQGAIQQVFGPTVQIAWYKDPAQLQHALAETPMALVGYYPVPHAVKGLLRSKNELESYIRFNEEPPYFQLGEGWHRDEGGWHWIAPQAELTLCRPQGATAFEIAASLPPDSIQRDGPARVTVSEDGRMLGTRILGESSVQRLHWDLAGGDPGDRKITIRSEPVRRLAGDSRELGIVVRAIGYVTL